MRACVVVPLAVSCMEFRLQLQHGRQIIRKRFLQMLIILLDSKAYYTLCTNACWSSNTFINTPANGNYMPHIDSAAHSTFLLPFDPVRIGSIGGRPAFVRLAI